MEFILIYLIIVAIGIGIELKMELQMFKDIADAGYKFDLEVLNELNKAFKNQQKSTILSLLIPGVNFAYLADKAKKYQAAKPYLLDSLYVLNIIEKMNDYEKGEYEKKPTGLRSISVPIICKAKLENALVLEIEEAFGTSKIYYERNPKTMEYNVLYVEGPAKHLSKEELAEKVKKHFEQARDLVMHAITEAIFSQAANGNNSEREELELLYQSLEAEAAARRGEEKPLKRTLEKPKDK